MLAANSGSNGRECQMKSADRSDIFSVGFKRSYRNVVGPLAFTTPEPHRIGEHIHSADPKLCGMVGSALRHVTRPLLILQAFFRRPGCERADEKPMTHVAAGADHHYSVRQVERFELETQRMGRVALLNEGPAFESRHEVRNLPFDCSGPSFEC